MKKFKMTKDWSLAMAEREGTSEVGAGYIARDPVSQGDTGVIPIDRDRLAFGRLINLLRRRQQLSVEELAEKAGVDAAEVIRIEDDLHFVPDPRTVYQLAGTFGLPQQQLMQVAGLATAQDLKVREAAVRFAARSEPVAKLAREERSALDAFLIDLSDPKGSKA